MDHDIAAAIGAASFWMFVAICAVAAMVRVILRHHEAQKTIRQIIEKGQTLDPETIERLMKSGRPPRPPRAGLMFGGIMMLAIAVGLALMGWLGAGTNPGLVTQGLAPASIVGLIGIGLLVSYFVLPRDPDET